MLQAAEMLCFNLSFALVKFHVNESFFTNSIKTLGFNKLVASVFQDSSSHTLRDQLKEPSIKLMILDFSLSNVLLLLESCHDSSAADADALPSFLLHQGAKILCAPVFEHSYGLSKPNIGLIFGKWHRLLPYIHLVLIMILLIIVPLASLLIFPCYLKDYCLILFTQKKGHQIKREQHGFMKSRFAISEMIIYLDSVFSAHDTNSSALSIYFHVKKNF